MADAANLNGQGTAVAEVPRAADVAEPATISKWYRWRKDGTALVSYLLDSEVHTFAFSVAANAILSFIPFIVLLYTLSRAVFHSPMMVSVVNDMVYYFLPSNQEWVASHLADTAPRHGVQVLSLVMILVSCTGIFLPLEVALNQAWGVTKSRNYLFNQVVAFGLAGLMVVLALVSILLNAGEQELLTLVFFQHTDNFLYKGICFRVAGFFNRRGLDSVLLFDLLGAAQPESPLAAGSAHRDCDGNRVAAGQVSIHGGSSPSGSEGAVWAVLCVGGAPVLGVCFGADPVCGSAVQRGAVGRQEQLLASRFLHSKSKQNYFNNSEMALIARGESSFVTGHDFSRAERHSKASGL